MHKKSIKKEHHPHQHSTHREAGLDHKHTETHEHHSIEHKILDNLVSLQKVHTNMAEKFDNLSDQISKLLALFEISAQTFAKHPYNNIGTEKDKDFLDKVDKLLEQNKTIAKGLMLMEERIRERISSDQGQTQTVQFITPAVSSRPAQAQAQPRFSVPMPTPQPRSPQMPSSASTTGYPSYPGYSSSQENTPRLPSIANNNPGGRLPPTPLEQGYEPSESSSNKQITQQG